MDKWSIWVIGGVVVLVLVAGVVYLSGNYQSPASPTPVVSSPSPVASEANLQSFEIEGKPFEFSIKEIRVKEGDRVRITFKNTEGMHDWVIDEFNARTRQIQAGESETVEFVANKKGTFEYYCSVGNGYHRQQGMIGKLIVE